MTSGEREAAPALEVVRMLEDMCKFADQSDGKLSTSLVREYIHDLRAALLEPVGEGWVMVPTVAMIDVAKRNLRAYLSRASFASNVDREAALNCVEVLAQALAPSTAAGRFKGN